MLVNEARKMDTLSREELATYLAHAPSMAVDAENVSAFRSPSGEWSHPFICTASDLEEAGKEGDFIVLDMLSPQKATSMIWLVDEGTARLLRHAVHESSVDGRTWVSCCKPAMCIFYAHE